MWPCCIHTTYTCYNIRARATDSRGSHRCCKLRQRGVHYYYYRDASNTTPPPWVVIHYILFVNRYCNSNLVPWRWGRWRDRILYCSIIRVTAMPSCHRALYKYTHRLYRYIYIYFGKLAVGWWRYRGRRLTFVEHACDHYNNTLSTCFYILYCTVSDAHTQYKNAEWKTTHIIARVYIFYNIRCDILVSPQYSAPCRRANIVLTRLR
jgi:hypothetical protein